jgi:hypothetical protein
MRIKHKRTFTSASSTSASPVTVTVAGVMIDCPDLFTVANTVLVALNTDSGPISNVITQYITNSSEHYL